MEAAMNSPDNYLDTLTLLRDEALRLFRGAPAHQLEVATAIPYLSFIRRPQPTEMNKGMLEPSLCLVLQGKKKVLIGQQIIDYGIGNYVLAAFHIPVSGQITEASQAAPYLGLKINLDPKEITALIIESGMQPPPQIRHTGPGAYVDESDADLQDALLRLVRLLHKPADIPILSHLIKQEIFYRLLTAKEGGALYQTLLASYREKGINAAIHWIKDNYAEPMEIEQLAQRVSMSVSSLHHRFKAITTMSPLQYQKQTRLLEARKFLLGGNVEAATAAFKVGYESPSQFSREYRRLFGASPLQDMAYLKHHQVE
jgi:AraC-like DNA-binding protein